MGILEKMVILHKIRFYVNRIIIILDGLCKFTCIKTSSRVSDSVKLRAWIFSILNQDPMLLYVLFFLFINERYDTGKADCMKCNVYVSGHVVLKKINLKRIKAEFNYVGINIEVVFCTIFIAKVGL